MIRLGMIGSGFISRFQLVAMGQVRGLELAALLDRQGSVELAEYARRHGIGPARICGSIAELVQQVDAVAIYSPNYTRVEVMEELVQAARSGGRLKGLICEKPLGRNLAEARRMVELAEEIAVPTAYFENQIFMKPIRAQFEQLAPLQERMGPLHLTRAAEEHGGPHEPWFWDPVRQGGGVLSDMGCHSIAVGWMLLTPPGKPLTFLRPESVSAQVALLKWGLPHWREKLKKEKGVDYSTTPAEDFATGVITYRNPESGQRVQSQFTNSWMFEKQGLRLLMDGTGPGYSFEVNTLLSPLTIFIADSVAESAADAETALEKSTASRGLLAVHYNEADLYGYTDENQDAASAFEKGEDGLLPWSFGLEITRLVMAAYLSAERGCTIDLTDQAVSQELETYRPAIQLGQGTDQLFGLGSRLESG